jgi:hypothetical protein
MEIRAMEQHGLDVVIGLYSGEGGLPTEMCMFCLPVTRLFCWREADRRGPEGAPVGKKPASDSLPN